MTGLRNGTSYIFTVHATNSVGSSGESIATAAVTPMTTPGVPSGISTTAGPEALTLSFTAPDSGGSPITGYQISLDGGENWTTFTPSGSPLTGTATGLQSGVRYSVALRAVNAVGTGTASTATSVTTKPATVTRPTATAGTSSTTVTWPQSTTGVVTGYTVYAHPGPATCATTSITATSCVIGATAGVSYTYTVVAHSPGGDSLESDASTSTVAQEPAVPVSAPAAAPATLTTTEGVLSTVDPGQQITVLGTGFAPYSTAVIIVYSAPIVLGTVVADSDGNFTRQITVPASLAIGEHDLVASGVDASGETHMIRMAVTVEKSATPPRGDSGDSGGSGQLPTTGAPVQMLVVWATLIIGAGIAMIAYARSRPAHQSHGC
nr:fibronectin type III domain-containing protein [Actinoplanes consettensis]